MTRFRVGAVGAAAAVLLAAGSGGAQPPVPGGPARPTNRPVFSPYLNLVRPGGSPALNYFGLVRPEVQARRAIQELAEEVSANRDAISSVELGESDLPVTGLQTSFLTPFPAQNLGGYFPQSQRSGGGGGFAPTRGVARGSIAPVNQLTNPANQMNPLNSVIGGQMPLKR